VSTQSRELVGEALQSAARSARLDLTPERLTAVAPMINSIYGMLGALDDVPLGETPPATAFAARWE
jgi:Asp-tRNA(Asn)/Glu-tRNA(Gln) amidotransferase C subunit